MVYILTFFIAHWLLSIFCQTFFLHRYGAHRMFSMNMFWERFFHLMTYIGQGPSFLNPRGYAILHRMHHSFSDTDKDPHSPHHYSDPMTMMLATKEKYDDFAYDRKKPEPRFDGGTPEWPALDRFGQSWFGRIGWVLIYTAFYYVVITTQDLSFYWAALLPIHFVMGPIHGAIVNWGGHKYGYQNFDNGDKSVNALFIDFITMGELFQNNHHKYGMAPNFAVRWFEVDLAYQVIRLLNLVGIIKLGSPQLMHYPAPQRQSGEQSPAFPDNTAA